MAAVHHHGQGRVVTATGGGSGRKPGACGNPWRWLADHSGPGWIDEQLTRGLLDLYEQERSSARTQKPR